MSIVKIKPLYYVHVLDNNTNVTRLIVGPQTYIRRDHESLSLGPEAMVRLPPRHYCKIDDPIDRDAEGKVLAFFSPRFVQILRLMIRLSCRVTATSSVEARSGVPRSIAMWT